MAIHVGDQKRLTQARLIAVNQFMMKYGLNDPRWTMNPPLTDLVDVMRELVRVHGELSEV
jgi:hypothetical protein